SNQAGNRALLEALRGCTDRIGGKAILIGTTGLSQDQIDGWRSLAAAGAKVLLAPNTSIGILLVTKLVQQAASLLSRLGYDIELIESHHREKRDQPSGTALHLAKEMQRAVSSLTIQETPRQSTR